MTTSQSILKLNLEPSPSVSLTGSSTTDNTLEVDDCRDITNSDRVHPAIPNLTTIKAGYYSSSSGQTSMNSIKKQFEHDVPTLDLLLSFIGNDEDIILQKHGYLQIDKICDTLQGELFRAIKMDINSSENPNYVAIKKTNKKLFKQRIAIENDFSFCVSENIVKEAFILKYLTIDHTPIGNYIVKFLDFFESDTNYYLVMEYIESQMTLKQFVSISHVNIENGSLSIKTYNQCIKYLLWQLFTTIQWLHTSIHCCHLDLCMENIMVINANFIESKNGISIDPKVSIKLCDFGVSEIFKATKNNNFFLCEKHGLSINNESYLAPKVFNGEIYDARCADNWSLGIILFECITGQCLYGAMDINTNSIKSGYWSLHNNKLKEYLKMNKILKKFWNINSFNLLNDLLNVNQYQRLKGMDILRHKWFRTYFKEYQVQITKKFKVSNKIKSTDYDRFPFSQNTDW